MSNILGFIGSESFLNKVCDVVKDLKSSNPGLIYGECGALILLKARSWVGDKRLRGGEFHAVLAPVLGKFSSYIRHTIFSSVTRPNPMSY